MLIRGLGGEVHPHRISGADVEEQGPGEFTAVAHQSILRAGRQRSGAGREWALAAGVHGFPVGQEPAAVKNSDPAKNVTASQRVPTALA